MAVRLLVLESRPVVRLGLRGMLAARPSVELVGDGAGTAALLHDLPQLRPDVVLAGCAELSPFPEILRFGGSAERPWRTVVLGCEPVAARVSEMVRAGVAAQVPLAADADEVEEVVTRVARGDFGAGRAELRRDIARPDPSGPTPDFGLTARELAIVRCIAGGMTPSAVAGELNLAHSTVSTFLRRVKDKLGLETNYELVRFAAVSGLMAPVPDEK